MNTTLTLNFHILSTTILLKAQVTLPIADQGARFRAHEIIFLVLTATNREPYSLKP